MTKFAQSRLYILITKHGGKIYFVISFAIIVVAFYGFNHTYQYFRLLYVLLGLGLAFLFVGRLLKKIVCEFEIFIDQKTVVFYPCRDEPFECSFDMIKDIIIKKNVVFVFDGKKMIYNGIIDENLIKYVKQIKSI